MNDYKKYRWFYTSKDTLVVGGKNALQNDSLLREIVRMKKDFYVMHTSSPGSPFSILMKDKELVSEKEMEECAIFTGCFSRAWKEDKNKANIDVFTSNQLVKEKGMKEGMWKVVGKVEKRKVALKLALTRQKGVLRAVPSTTAKKKDILMYICPGKNNKEMMAPAFEIDLGNVSHDELMAAIPAGGVRRCS